MHMHSHKYWSLHDKHDIPYPLGGTLQVVLLHIMCSPHNLNFICLSRKAQFLWSVSGTQYYIGLQISLGILNNLVKY